MDKIIYRPVICLIILCVLAAVICYPTGKVEQGQFDTQSNEKYFPNGTVIGKYSYVDKEGNPIEVKYYADDASYGVELKSIKVLEASSDPTIVTDSKDALVSNIPQDVLSTAEDLKNDPFELLNKEMKKFNQHKADKSSPDFEIYYQNELNGPKKCGQEKVRVYFDRDRKIRNVLNNLEADKYCDFNV